MRKNIVINCCVVLLLAVLASCKDNSAFTISGAVTNPGSVKKIFLLQADSTAITVVDSTSLGENGKFQFKHHAPYANLFNLRIGNNVFDLIAKNGDDITFSTNLTDSTHSYAISGSDDSGKIQ